LVPGGIVSLVIIGIGILFIPVESVGNLIYIVGYYNGTIAVPTGVTSPKVTSIDIFGAAAQIGMLFVFLGITLIPAIVRVLSDNKKGVQKELHKHY
jgi:hypothetical protein